jgi:hypothetical protein
VLFTGAAAAGAADLISSGEPVKKQPADRRYESTGDLTLAVKAPDKPLSWGVEVYTSPDGRTCALAGQVRGFSLGLIKNGVFHAYPKGRGGACGTLTNKQGGFISAAFGENRTAVYGRVRAGASSVTLVVDGKSKPVPVGPGGAFLAVYDGRASVSDWTVNG